MNITPLKVTVREVVTGYVDDSDREEGIYGYSGRLNIRPGLPLFAPIAGILGVRDFIARQIRNRRRHENPLQNYSCGGSCRRRQGQNPRDGSFAGGLQNAMKPFRFCDIQYCASIEI